ncbi:MAG: LysM domain-containing protein [Opitutaceae bacterium]|nr:LysM domain-containing protein [Opitutaceae bacterium]
MLIRLLLGSALAATAAAQFPASQVDLANFREDIRGLNQRVSELSLRIEQLERENNEHRGRSGATEKTYATLTQLDNALTDLSHTLKTAIATSKNETLQQVSGQIERLGRQTNAAIDSLAKGMATRPSVQTTFSEEFPREGVSYTVQKGDTLAVIAKKTGAKTQHIINANKIADPGRIQVGQTLFIPGGK